MKAANSTVSMDHLNPSPGQVAAAVMANLQAAAEETRQDLEDALASAQERFQQRTGLSFSCPVLALTINWGEYHEAL
ncbi:hypothetical protein [Acidovorax sp. NCPPB 3576]|uniref:hypothetical protein n=1 Tax=Acidovorax sp. NCPPB 3576 TaxID=2940488 RepID=UPI00234B8909|nr:hypothetical protein [Acidovorax sp. NCPPB 3576]WCM88806.1 hypothetical protein M5C98_01765 [Acidovorax sp. NCPPB 3576]